MKPLLLTDFPRLALPMSPLPTTEERLLQIEAELNKLLVSANLSLKTKLLIDSALIRIKYAHDYIKDEFAASLEPGPSECPCLSPCILTHPRYHPQGEDS